MAARRFAMAASAATWAVVCASSVAEVDVGYQAKGQHAGVNGLVADDARVLAAQGDQVASEKKKLYDKYYEKLLKEYMREYKQSHESHGSSRAAERHHKHADDFAHDDDVAVRASASKCRSVAELKAWHAREEARIRYIPEEYRKAPMAHLKEEFARNMDRLRNKEAEAAGRAGAETSPKPSDVTEPRRRGTTREAVSSTAAPRTTDPPPPPAPASSSKRPSTVAPRTTEPPPPPPPSSTVPLRTSAPSSTRPSTVAPRTTEPPTRPPTSSTAPPRTSASSSTRPSTVAPRTTESPPPPPPPSSTAPPPTSASSSTRAETSSQPSPSPPRRSDRGHRDGDQDTHAVGPSAASGDDGGKSSAKAREEKVAADVGKEAPSAEERRPHVSPSAGGGTTALAAVGWAAEFSAGVGVAFAVLFVPVWCALSPHYARWQRLREEDAPFTLLDA